MGTGIERFGWERISMRFMLAFLLFLTLATPVFAVDGVLEISHACAVNTGCFSGDTAGYPVTIDGTAGRSYLLTSDLIVPDVDTDGIKVNTSDIGIDLNNFTIIRSGCEGATSNCTPTPGGTGSGVNGYFPQIGISVKNGSITGMGRYGVYLGSQAEVSGLRVRWNKLDGIFTSSGAVVSGNAAYQNGSRGIFANTGSTVSNNAVYQNGMVGIETGFAVNVLANTADQNGGVGIFADAGSTVSNCVVSGNGGHGIVVENGSTASGNTAYQNGGAGIFASAGSNVSGNAVRSNTGYGLSLNSSAAYRDNVINGNTAGTVSGGVNMGTNSCNGTTTCP
jgi:hypothetical protein